MTTDHLLQQIEFIKEIDKVKYILRRTKLFNSDRRENDAEHSWHLAVMAIILAEHSNEKIDLLKVIKMLLIHDIVEIDAGDTFIYDTTKSHENTDEERMAAQRIFGILPKQQAQDLIDIWEEFEANVSAEAKFARSMDRLEPFLQNTSNDGGTWSEFDVPLSKVMEKKSVIRDGSTAVYDYGMETLEENVQKGIIKDDTKKEEI